MAHKAESFRIDEKKKNIILYSNVSANGAEKQLIDYYLSNGYKPKTEEKKAGITVKEMRKELEAAPDVLAKFNEAYEKKTKKKDGEKGEVPYFAACKIYTNWKKEQKKAK